MDNLRLNNSRPIDRIKNILNSPVPAHLVQSMPAQELLLAIKSAGFEDSLQLIELLSSEQVKTILDLDAWKFDKIDSAALNLWLAALAQANPVTAFEQMRDADIELLTLILRNCAQIHDLIEEENPLVNSDLILVTTDRHYLLEFNTAPEFEVQSRFMRSFIDDLMGQDFLFAIRLIESARFETDSLLQEDALRLRDGRLQDLGFLPFSETLSILSYIEIQKTKKSSLTLEENRNHKNQLTFSHLNPNLDELVFLKMALTGQSNKVLESSWSYIATVANRVHMAFNGKYSDSDAVNESAKFTLSMIEMALSFKSEGNLSEAKQVFLSYAPQDLFKIGHSIVLSLNREFRKLINHKGFELLKSSPLRLDSPLREVVKGVIQPEPLFYDGLIDPKCVTFRAFRNLQDIALSRRAISEAAFRCALMGSIGLGYKENESENKEINNIAAFGVILATYFVHIILTGKGSFNPLNESQLQLFFDRFEKLPSHSMSLNNNDKSTCVMQLSKHCTGLVGLLGMSSEEEVLDRTQSYANVVFGFIESEFSNIKDSKLDASLVTSLLIERN